MKRKRFPHQFLRTLMEFCSVTAHDQLLMGIRLVNHASTLELSVTRTPAKRRCHRVPGQTHEKQAFRNYRWEVGLWYFTSLEYGSLIDNRYRH